MRVSKKITSVFLSLSIVLSAFTGAGYTALASDSKTVSGKVVIATTYEGDTGEDGITGINIYNDLSSQPLGTTDENGDFSVVVPAETSSLVFSNHTFENGEHHIDSEGCTIDRTVTLTGTTDISGVTVPIIICDYNGDGAVSAADKQTFSRAMASTVSDSNYNVYCNLNADSGVSAADKQILSRFMGNVKVSYQYPELILEGHAHEYSAVITEATCTETGYTTYTCSVCGDTYTSDEVAPLGHDFGEWTVSAQASCTQSGTETRSCSRCDATETRATAALGHTEGEAVEENRNEAGCTESGSYDSVVYCTVCGAELSRETITLPAAGHSYTASVTAASCTEAGYTTYTCSVCGDTYTSDEVAPLGHDWVAGETVAPTHTTDGYTAYTCSRCGETKQDDIIPALNIKVKLENTEDYLYRAGNSNSIALTHLFEAENQNTAIDSSAVTVNITNIAGSAAGTYTANAGDWTAASVKFTGTGVIKLTVKQAGYVSAELMLEIVNGTNLFEGADFGGATSANAVLLGNVNCPSTKNVNNGKTLYGNGFSVTDTRSSTASTNGYINMSENGTIDNAKLIGQVYSSAVTSGTTNEGYAPGIWITGNANIYNSYVCEAKYAVQIDGGSVVLENSTFDGGAIANVCISGADVTMKNCTTTVSTHGGLKGLGVRVTSASANISIEGTFTQYNWLKKSDLPSLYTSFLNSLYSDSNYAYTYNGTAYVNMGVFFITDAGTISASQAQACVNDSTGNAYGYIEKSAASITGTLYTAKASMGSAAMMTGPVYDETVYGQYPTLPTNTFNYTKNDFTTDDKTYCTYNSTTGITQISFEEGSSMNWDSDILTVTKNGASLPVTVNMNGTNYTGQSIPFTEGGEYTVNYSYSDPYNYDKNGNAYSVSYTKSVKISVTVVEKGVQVYHPDFTYASIGGTTASRSVEATVSGAKRVYIMPDVSAANSSGGTFSSGKLYYFAPAFKYINITDYDQSNQTTKTAQYTYNSSTQKWPHNVTASSQPDTGVYYYTATNTSTNTNRPYGRSMNEQYYGYKYVSSQGGLCFSSNEIEKQNNANSQLVEFYYKGTDDITYYYYIKYSFEAATGSSGGCVAEGTQVTMGDGSTKAIEDIKVGEKVMSLNPETGEYEPQSVAIHCDHGTKDWDVLTLKFSDGTQVRSIYDHGYFDTTLNTYAYIRTDNVSSFIGDSFIKRRADGSVGEVTLEDYEITTENVGSYTLVSAYNYNFIVEGMLSMTSEDGHDGMFEFFDYGENGRYDTASMQKDIETYGLYTYEDFSEYLTREQFEALNFKFYKPNVEKGIITFDEIILMIQQYM